SEWRLGDRRMVHLMFDQLSLVGGGLSPLAGPGKLETCRHKMQVGTAAPRQQTDYDGRLNKPAVQRAGAGLIASRNEGQLMKLLTIRSVQIAASMVLLWAQTLQGQETGADRHAQAKKHLQRVAAEMSARCLSEVRDLQDWQHKRPE